MSNVFYSDSHFVAWQLFNASGMWHHNNKQVNNIQWEYTVVSKYAVVDFKTNQDEECVLMLINL